MKRDRYTMNHEALEQYQLLNLGLIARCDRLIELKRNDESEILAMTGLLRRAIGILEQVATGRTDFDTREAAEASALLFSIIARLSGHTLTQETMVPDGWKLVPVEPTSSMCRAGMNAANPRWAYKEMLEAAPNYDNKAG